jgi:transcriptional regulator with XRE-family HTH domain
MEDPAYRAAYEQARDRLARTDALVRSLEERRAARGLTKADLARKAGLAPEVVRRLFTMESPNPTAGTLVALADALDLELVTTPKKATKAKRSSARQRAGRRATG